MHYCRAKAVEKGIEKGTQTHLSQITDTPNFTASKRLRKCRKNTLNLCHHVFQCIKTKLQLRNQTGKIIQNNKK